MALGRRSCDGWRSQIRIVATSTVPVDEYNRPARAGQNMVRVPPAEPRWRSCSRPGVSGCRGRASSCRQPATTWPRRCGGGPGLRIGETVVLDIPDWRPDLGEHGKLHVRFGKRSRGRGPKTRLVPAIDSVDSLLGWWLTDIRHQFGGDWADPDAPLPSERRDRMTGCCQRAGDSALRAGLAGAVSCWLPAWPASPWPPAGCVRMPRAGRAGITAAEGAARPARPVNGHGRTGCCAAHVSDNRLICRFLIVRYPGTLTAFGRASTGAVAVPAMGDGLLR